MRLQPSDAGTADGERPGRSGTQEDLDRLALVHRAIAVGGLLERQLEVEDLARVDLAVPDKVDQLGQEATHRRGSAVQVGEAPEQVHAIDGDAVRDADEADVSAGAGPPWRCTRLQNSSIPGTVTS